MATKIKTSKTTTSQEPKISASQRNMVEITNMFIEGLKKGDIPWKRPFNGIMPQNISGRAYNGFNAFFLGWRSINMGWTYPVFMTFNQVVETSKKLGVDLSIKGEKGNPIIFYMFKPDELDSQGNIVKRGYPILKPKSVFNVAQVAGLPVEEFLGLVKVAENLDAEAILAGAVKNGLPNIENTGGQVSAYFSPELDKIFVPSKNLYPNLANYYGSCFHELVHATGVEGRLGRPSLVEYFKNPDAKCLEELIAEIGSAMLLDRCGLLSEEVLENKQAYCNGWASFLQGDPNAIRQAANEAAKAVAYILGSQESKEDSDEE